MLLGKELIARPRFSSKGSYGKLFMENKRLFFMFNEENMENSEGQHIVLYQDNILTGGGEIKF